MSKKFIVALLCLVIMIITAISKNENENLSSLGERLVSAIYQSPSAVAVFNIDKGVFI